MNGSIFVSLVLNLVLIIGILYGQSLQLSGAWTRYLIYFFWHFGCNVVMFYILFIYNFHIIKYRRKLRGAILYMFLGTIVLCGIISPVLSRVQWVLLRVGTTMDFEKFASFNMTKDVIVGITVMVVTYTIYLAQKREQILITNQKLVEENIRIKYESLKNQLDPHFLFNSLNTLNGLIGGDEEKIHDYIDNLSSVFRFTLHSKNICTLDEEIEFADSYLYLMKIRYGDNLQMEYDINPKYRKYSIMPASIQLLVENAVKHNEISDSAPLHIDIKTTDDATLVVSNVINPKMSKSIGGIGLANLSERYRILFAGNVKIENTGKVFSVSIPLIRRTSKKIDP